MSERLWGGWGPLRLPAMPLGSGPAHAVSAAPVTTVLLLPGLLCDATVWQAQCAGLGAERCVVPDYGLADSVAAMARAALAQTDAPRLAVVGHSLGARVALDVLRQAPQRVERLALLDCGVDALASGPAGEREVARRSAMQQAARAQGMRAMGEAWLRSMVHPEHQTGAMFERMVAMVERRTLAELAAQVQALQTRPSARAVLRAATCPVWLMCGRQDPWTPLAAHEAMRADCPEAQLAVLETCGHMAPMEQPEAVTRLLRDWLQA